MEKAVTSPTVRIKKGRTAFLLRRLLGRTIVYALLLAGSIIFLFPFLWMVSTSLKASSELYIWPPAWIPEQLLFSNYTEAWVILPFSTFYWNTLKVVILTIIGRVISCTLVAYGFARMRFPERDFLFVVLLGTMMLPGQVTMIPLYMLFAKIKWINSILPLVVPSFFGNAFHIFLLRQFFLTIPRELDDAAKIDGCGYLRTLTSIILPLAMPVIGVVTIFTFNAAWNNFLGPLIYLQTLEQFTIAVGMRMFQRREDIDVSYLMAMAVVALIPQIAVFFFAQRQMVQGVVLTGIKG
jgi:ABC-type glycerol-3-phosphate transport system permease component